MNCLNLPPTMRNQVFWTYLARITPGPNAPSIITINHILKPLVDQLLEFEKGQVISTHHYPNGQTVQVRLLPLLGDVVGVHKTAGFASHSARFFCSWCKCIKPDLSKLELGQPRSKLETLKSSQDYLNHSTLHMHQKVLDSTGVRYSELHRLNYPDPVLDNPLGMMHNWLEGVLQHHF